MSDCAGDPTDDYSPRYVGDTQSLTATFKDHSGTIFPLTGVNAANIVLRLYNPSSDVTKTGAGTWTIIDAVGGVAKYAVAAADVNTAGLWQMQVYVPFPTGGQHMDIKEIDIKPVL